MADREQDSKTERDIEKEELKKKMYKFPALLCLGFCLPHCSSLDLKLKVQAILGA